MDTGLQQLKQNVHKALKQWHQPDVQTAAFSHLALFQGCLQNANGAPKRAVNQMLLQGLAQLELHYKQDAILLRRAFLDNELNRILAVERDISEATLYRHIDTALVRLAESVWQLETEISSGLQSNLLQRLELPTNADLVGIEDHMARVSEILRSPAQPWLISLEGMGGIGKTTLADAVLRSLVQQGHTQAIAWVTARQQAFAYGTGIREVERPTLSVDALVEALVTQLHPNENIPPNRTLHVLTDILKAQAHLIVIDNLETVADVETLLTTLRTLANPSKFLLTTRASLFSEPDVYTFAVPELTEPGALALLRHEAEHRNLTRLQSANDAALRTIYQTVGGNPLALRLVAGQTHVHALDIVLESLQKAQGRKIEELYTYIYREAWDQLDEATRLVFLAMPLATSFGATPSHIGELTGLPPSLILEALEILVRLNLVDSRDDVEPRFTIHSLTRSFLHEQVLQWS
ncbi:MAG: NB-ARC domain-containing protein [Litorilinea sp.]